MRTACCCVFVIDPLLRNHEAVAILICIWGSAPLGIVIGELVRRRLDRPGLGTAAAAAPPAEQAVRPQAQHLLLFRRWPAVWRLRSCGGDLSTSGR